MAQPCFGSPFGEADLRDEPRFRPAHLVHVLRGDAASPVPRACIGQIRERAVGNYQWFELANQLATDVCSKSRTHLTGELQLSPCVVADQQCVQPGRTLGSKAPDDELLLLLEFQFDPIATALAGLVARVFALGDHALDSRRLQRLNDVAGSPWQDGRQPNDGIVPYDFRKQVAPHKERLADESAP